MLLSLQRGHESLGASGGCIHCWKSGGGMAPGPFSGGDQAVEAARGEMK